MAAHSLIPGRTIGHFRLTEKIGAGGMGTVYRAWDMQLERDVAVKVLKSRSDRVSERSRLRKEALALSRLNHPNIESIYSIESDPDRWRCCRRSPKRRHSSGSQTGEHLSHQGMRCQGARFWAGQNGRNFQR